MKTVAVEGWLSEVRQSSKRERVPEYLEIHKLRALLLAELKEREKTLVLLDAATGIRRGELRHTFSMLLKANGEDVKVVQELVVQELLRHANCRIILDIYTHL